MIETVESTWNDFKASATDKVNKGVQWTINGIQTQVDTIANALKKEWNSGIDTIITRIRDYKGQIEQVTGIKTMGYSYSGRTAAGISASYGIGVVFDSEGNLVAQLNGNIGGGFLGGGSGPTLMFTNAPSYKDLEGWGGVIGGSLACKFFDIGYDQFFMSGYTGSSIGGEVGIYPFKIQMHGEVGYTVTVGKVNVYDILENLKFTNVCTCY